MQYFFNEHRNNRNCCHLPWYPYYKISFFKRFVNPEPIPSVSNNYASHRWNNNPPLYIARWVKAEHLPSAVFRLRWSRCCSLSSLAHRGSGVHSWNKHSKPKCSMPQCALSVPISISSQYPSRQALPRAHPTPHTDFCLDDSPTCWSFTLAALIPRVNMLLFRQHLLLKLTLKLYNVNVLLAVHPCESEGLCVLTEDELLSFFLTIGKGVRMVFQV